MITSLAIVALLATMGLALIRAIQGPTVYDRILAANTFNTKTVLMIAALGFVTEEAEDYLDIALAYAIIGFISTLAVLRSAESGVLRHSKSPDSNNGEAE